MTTKLSTPTISSARGLGTADGPAARMGPSLVRAVAEAAWAYPDAIRLELGEPGLATPGYVIDAAHAAARAGATTYAPNAGIPELRGALADKIARVNGYAVEPGDVIVGAGAVQVLFATLTALVRPGDEVLLPDPAWPDYEMMCELLGAVPVRYPLYPERAYRPDPEDVERLIGVRTRAVLVNSPSNPLGTVLDSDMTSALLEVAARRGVWLISDECYDELTFDGSFRSAGALASPEMAKGLVSLYSFSKVHGMTGWRVGYAAMPSELATIVGRAQEPLVSCVNTPAQHAALTALRESDKHVPAIRERFRARRDLVCAALASAGIEHFIPQATFYVWLSLGDPSIDSVAWALELLEEERVAVAPGIAFGPSGAGCVRLSLSVSDELLTEGIRRIASKLARDR
jgi:aspartate aminotransferase